MCVVCVCVVCMCCVCVYFAGDRGTSCTEQFDINVSPLVPRSCDVAQELRQVHASFVRHISQLRRVYHVYSSLDDPLGSRPGGNRLRQVMTRMQVCITGKGGQIKWRERV